DRPPVRLMAEVGVERVVESQQAFLEIDRAHVGCGILRKDARQETRERRFPSAVSRLVSGVSCLGVSAQISLSERQETGDRRRERHNVSPVSRLASGVWCLGVSAQTSLYPPSECRPGTCR